jgi:hypothetical protein
MTHIPLFFDHILKGLFAANIRRIESVIRRMVRTDFVEESIAGK